jgi:hypothetical protein
MPTTAPPRRTTSADHQPILENFYNLREAAVRLGLAKKDDPEDLTGQNWLRRGVNRPEDGSKGPQFPSIYMAGQLMFSDSHLAAIVQIAATEPRARPARRTPARRPRKAPAAAGS